MGPFAKTHPDATKRYACGCASAEVQAFLETEHVTLDATLARRKGELALPCVGPEATGAIRVLCESYYANPSFDVAPALVAALRRAEREMPTLLEHAPVAVVVRDMELVAVGVAGAAVRVLRHGAMREVFSPLGPGASLRATLVDRSPNRLPLYMATWRLAAGDIVVASVQEAFQRIGEAPFRRILRQSRTASSAALAISRAGRGGHGEPSPVAVIYSAGLSPVPEMAARPGARPAEKPAAIRPRRQGHSPVWIAVVIAVVAIGISLWVRRPDLSRESLKNWANLMLVPNPTPVPSKETPAPAALLAAPHLISPREDDMLLRRDVVLRWNWEGRLGEDMAFDVRLWRAGAPEESIAVTRELQHTAHLLDMGWYEWTVIVVRAKEGVAGETLSLRPDSMSFLCKTSE